MFYLQFGNYLVNHAIISSEEFRALKHKVTDERVRLGVIAIQKGLLTKEQAEEINHLQALKDKRFGDIAIEKGYLTDAQLKSLLALQGNSFLKFVQILTDASILTFDEIDKHLKAYQVEKIFSDADMELLKDGDVDDVISQLVPIKDSYYKEIVSLVIRNLIRFISTDVLIGTYKTTTSYTAEFVALQHLEGAHNITLGFGGNGTSLLSIANPYAKETFSFVDEDAFDAICEFINCINGLFARKLSTEDIEIDMLPPVSKTNTTIQSDKLLVVPITISEQTIDIIISIDTPIEFI